MTTKSGMAAWLTPMQTAEVTGHHPDTIRRALEAGELHGHQRCHRGRWRIHPDAPHIWIRGGNSAEPCGCSRVVPMRARRTA